MKITIVAGARPNFMKVAPLINSIKLANESGKNIDYKLVHTGQHFDHNMSDTFFEELKIPFPDVNLRCGGGTQSEQTASIMIAFEHELINCPTDLVLVVGDVNSTLACSIVAKKLNIQVAHVEAGIRSGDMTMPEEINRIVTDSISDYFFTTTKMATDNLLKAGFNKSRIFFVGNVMIDTLLSNIERFKKPKIWEEFKLKPKKYLVLTLHRPNNVDHQYKLSQLLNEISECARELPVIFPIHPRTKNKITKIPSNLYAISPLSYLEFNYLVKNSVGVITDSGGISEETTVLNIPCITLRNTTERPETIEIGTNELVGDDFKLLRYAIHKLHSGKWKNGKSPEFWDGKSSDRIIEILLKMRS